MKEEKIILKKLLNCAYIIIALLAINTLIILVSSINDAGRYKKDSTKTSENSGTGSQNEPTGEYDVSMMNAVDVKEAIRLFDAKETQVIYIGRSSCGYCVKFLPSLQKAQKEYGYKTNYLDITTVTEDGHSDLMKKDNKDKFLEKNFGATPMVILVKDGKIVDTWLGYSEYDDFAQFLEKNGFKK